MSKIARKFMAHYVDSATASPAAYVRLGKDLEEFNVEMNANVNSTQNILGETSTNIDSYAAQSSVEPYIADSTDPMFTRLQAIIDGRQTLDDLKTTVVEVHLWETPETGAYAAFREDAIIEIVSYGGDTTGYQISWNVHHTGNRVEGTFNPSTKTFTVDAG